MACVVRGEESGRRRRRLVAGRILPATLASALLLTGIAAAGRPGPHASRTQAVAPVGEPQPVIETPSPVATLAAPTPAAVPTAPPRPPTPTPTATATPAPSPTPSPTPRPDLTALLRTKVADLDPDGVSVVSITVVHEALASSVRGEDPIVSASAAKLYWAVAAATQADDLSRLAADASAVFGWSDNAAAGRLIDVAGGVDAVNAYTAELGLGETSLSAWAYGGSRFASDRADRGNENLTSTSDLARFLDLFAAGALLEPEQQAVVEDWMRATPDDLASSPGLDGLLVDLLPADVAARTMHKAGWLPAGCCSAIDHVLVAGGIVPLPDGSSFSIAIAAQDSPDFDSAIAWIPEVVCEVYTALGGVERCRPQS